MTDHSSAPSTPFSNDPASFDSRIVNLGGGIRIHLAGQGLDQQGPLVLLVHGFPESWFSWRHQIPVLAQAGFRAAALDVRGYGRSSKPGRIDEYRMLRLVGDVVGIADALSPDRPVVLVGHDWGAPIVWNSALLRPDRFAGVAGLSVPYSPNGPVRPTEVFRAMAGAEHEFYIEYFQQPGRAEAEIEQDVRRWLLGFYFSASGDAPPDQPNIALVPNGQKVSDGFRWPQDGLPTWLPEEELDYYVGQFERTGLTGGLNRYRNVDRDWEDLTAFRDQPIEIPALFVGGAKDGPTVWGAPAIERFPQTLPRLHGSHILDGCGHWIQQERASEVNELLLGFLSELEL